MTDLYKKLYTADVIFRPPLEEQSLLLEVTEGCSYGRCYFCDFTRDKFYIFPLEEIGMKIKILGQIMEEKPRLYMMGCNPLCLETEKLIKILQWIRRDLPYVKSVSMYARADDILRKSNEELNKLRNLGVTDFHVGLESGSDEVLSLHNKGETVTDIIQALKKLTSLGISYHLSIILGMGGRYLSQTHAKETAKVLSNLRPLSIWAMALKIWPGTVLDKLVREEYFQTLSPLEILQEEVEMLKETHMREQCFYADSTALNQYTLMTKLPDGKESTIKQMEKIIRDNIKLQI